MGGGVLADSAHIPFVSDRTLQCSSSRSRNWKRYTSMFLSLYLASVHPALESFLGFLSRIFRKCPRDVPGFNPALSHYPECVVIIFHRRITSTVEWVLMSRIEWAWVVKTYELFALTTCVCRDFFYSIRNIFSKCMLDVSLTLRLGFRDYILLWNCNLI